MIKACFDGGSLLLDKFYNCVWFFFRKRCLLTGEMFIFHVKFIQQNWILIARMDLAQSNVLIDLRAFSDSFYVQNSCSLPWFLFVFFSLALNEVIHLLFFYLHLTKWYTYWSTKLSIVFITCLFSAYFGWYQSWLWLV